MPVDIPMRFPDAPLLWVVDQVYTSSECADFIAGIEGSTATVATDNPLYRDQARLIVDDTEMADDLFERLRPALPPSIGPLRLHALNPRLRMYRYLPGQRYAPHMDNWYRADAYHITLLSVVAYFNDDFEGGESRFSDQIDRTIVPRAGSVAVFQHKLRHEGCEVLRGSKYAMRADVLYESPEPIGLVGGA